MSIVLTEIRGEQKLARREFKQATVKIGRDPVRNNLAFERTRWPMVSRLHAEIRSEGGHWYLTDAGSRHGTLLNGQPISAATEIQSGAIIQLGRNGPIISVELIDDAPAPAPTFSETFVDDEAARAQAALRAKAKPHPGLESPMQTSVETPSVQEPRSEHTPVPRQPPDSPPTPSAPPVQKPAPVLICQSGSSTQLGREYVLNSYATLLGRDAAADISIEAAGAVVSRRHAEIRRQADGSYTIADLNSFNGTLVNDQRVTQPTTLHDGDRVQLATGGPIFRFVHPSSAPLEARATTETRWRGSELSKSDNGIGLRTIIARSQTEQQTPFAATNNAQLLFERSFDGKQNLSVGRGPENDIQLDGLLISKHHARLINTAQGVQIEDAGSTNGVYVNGGRVSGRHLVQNEDVVQIGPFVLRVDSASGIAVFDTRSKIRIDAIAITKIVHQPGRASRKLLDDISLAIEPNEFVGVLGPSGAGKSMLMNALNGMRRTSSGRVLINNLELYQHIDLLKQSIGYVPQDDIIHRELTVYRTLYYVARLRLSRDVRANEIDQIISEVLDVTGLSDRRDVLVSQLSGGQRKRVSIAVELITKPSVIFLDEPTSGLDPATEERIMKLFRQIAESGRTVILNTHAMENVRLFDRVVVLLRGKLIFYGTPTEALEFAGANSFVDLYNKLDAPVESEIAGLESLPPKATKAQRITYEQRLEEIADGVANEWRGRFAATDFHRRYIEQPLSLVHQEVQAAPPPRRRGGIIDALRQWATLVRRYAEVLASDKWNLAILFGQAPIIALLTYLVVGKNDPRDFPYFILALGSVWFGTSVAARELVKERPIFERERMVNLGLVSYVSSKLFVLSFIVGLQTTLLFATLKIFHFAGLISLPGYFLGLPQLLVLVLTGMVGIALGLFISALVKTSEVATSLVPLILIPQILFAGLVTVPAGISKIVGAVMPATWSFDEIKRLSSLDTLKTEGSDGNGPNKGRGLYQHTKELNNENITNARNQLEDYGKRVSETIAQQNRMQESLRSSANANSAVAAKSPENIIGPVPSIPSPQEINDNLSGYVTFKHPWGGLALDPAILFAMLLTFLSATIIALRLKDVR